jgi:uncharacterized protein (TIRG00374 family)
MNKPLIRRLSCPAVSMKLAGLFILIFVLALADTLGLIDFAAISHTLAAHPQIVSECFILTALSFACVALRLAALLKLIDVPISYSDCFKVTMLSLFSGTLLIGPLGTEATRFGMLIKKCEHRYAELTAVLLLDRVFGLSGLVCIVFFMSLVADQVSARIPYHHYMIAAFLLFFAALVLLFMTHKYLPTRRKQAAKELIRQHAPSLYKILSQLGRIFRTSKHIMSNPMTLFKLVSFSVMASFLPLIGLSEVINVFLPNTFDFPSSLMILSITILINSIGITPGGIGVGEAVFALFCFAVTRDASLPYVETFLSVRLISIICVLPGGLVLLQAPQREKAST